MALNRSRFIYTLAGALLKSAWTAEALRDAADRTAAPHRVPIARLPARVLAAFREPPEFYTLVAFLTADKSLARALRGPRSALNLPKIEGPLPALRGIGLPEIPTERALGEWLGVRLPQLQWRADIAGRNRRHEPGPLRTYRYRWIPRQKGRPRLLEIPKRPLKQIQRTILEEILDLIPVHPAAHGFCAGRSIVTNAAGHCGKPIVIGLDLVDFFSSVTSARVLWIFRSLGFPAQVSRLLTGLCTTRLPADVWESRPGTRDGADFESRQRLFGRHLPQGAPTSPALANLAAARLDRRLSGLAQKLGAIYTRYADDLTFSGGEALARAGHRLETIVAVITQEEGFSLNHRKTHRMRAGARQQVTGVVVNLRPNIARDEFDRLKAILTNCLRTGPAAQNRQAVGDFRGYLTGKVAFVSSIHPARGAKLQRILMQIAWN